MAYESGILWTESSFNPWMGCNKVSEACHHCYISGVMGRMGKEPFQGPMRTKTWENPLRWNRQQKEGTRRKVFTCSLSDWFHDGADQWRDEAWELVKQCDRLQWLILTKRIEDVPDRLPADWGDGYDNVWLGVTCEQQKHTHRIEKLLEIPAKLKWVSAEPLLGPLDLQPFLGEGKIEWVIGGCEQAARKKRQVMSPDWTSSLLAQCQQADVAYFHKQYYDYSISDGEYVETNTLKHDGVMHDGESYLQTPVAL